MKKAFPGEGFGADDEIRTRDLNLGKVALYQLSYVRLRRLGQATRLWPFREGMQIYEIAFLYLTYGSKISHPLRLPHRSVDTGYLPGIFLFDQRLFAIEATLEVVIGFEL